MKVTDNGSPDVPCVPDRRWGMNEDGDLGVLDRPVEDAARRLYRSGHLQPRDVPQSVWNALAGFDRTSAIQILENYGRKDPKTIMNRSSFLIGMMKRFRQLQSENQQVELRPGWATLPDVLKIRCNRDTLQQWLKEGDPFEAVLKGCVVRVLVGDQNNARTYRMCVIGGFAKGDETYKFGKIRTSTLLICKFGNLIRPFKMDYISNSDISEEEFADWVVQMERCRLPMITKDDVALTLRRFRQYAADLVRGGPGGRRRSRSRSRSHSSSPSSSSASSPSPPKKKAKG